MNDCTDNATSQMYACKNNLPSMVACVLKVLIGLLPPFPVPAYNMHA